MENQLQNIINLAKDNKYSIYIYENVNSKLNLVDNIPLNASNFALNANTAILIDVMGKSRDFNPQLEFDGIMVGRNLPPKIRFESMPILTMQKPQKTLSQAMEEAGEELLKKNDNVFSDFLKNIGKQNKRQDRMFL